MSSKINVSIRVRPLFDWEIKKQKQCAKLKIDPTKNQIKTISNDKETEKSYEFDYVSDGNTNQSEFYNRINRDNYIKRVTEGFHTSIFAYGQTGSGKTFTMDGHQYQVSNSIDKISKHKINVNPEDLGIIPRAICSLFQEINRASEAYNRTFSVYCSMLEIYNERIFDLLNPEQVNKLNNFVPGLRLRWNKTDQFVVENLFIYETQTADEVITLFQMGIKNKVIAMHKLNNSSSRSHCIFELKVESYSNSQPNDVLSSKLVFVDLAGSERIGLTGTEGRLAKESIDINKSLFTLRQVIMTIAESEGRRDVHIPYRDSKLTSLLKQSFGGNSYCLMIACLSPSDDNLEENLSTLNYASKARRIENRPVKNDDPKLKDITELKIKNHTLTQELLKANDHIAFLSRLTNNKIKVFGGSLAKEAQNSRNSNTSYSKSREINLDREVRRSVDDAFLAKTSKTKEFQKSVQDQLQHQTLNVVDSHALKEQHKKHNTIEGNTDEDNPAQQNTDGYLQYLSENFKDMSENEKKLPEYLSKELIHSINQIRNLLKSLNEERERNEALSIKNNELEGINAKLMEENRGLRDKIEVLEQLNLNSSKDDFRKSTANSTSQERSNAVEEIVKMKREKYFLEKRIRELEEQNVFLSLDFQSTGNGIFTPESQGEAPNSIQLSTLTSMKGQAEEPDSHFRTTTNYGRNSMYRKFPLPIDMRYRQSTAEPSRETGADELLLIELPPRTSGQRRDIPSLKPIYEQKSVNPSLNESQIEQSEFQRKDRVSRSINLPRGIGKMVPPKIQQKTDFITLNDLFTPKILPSTKPDQEKLLKQIQNRRVIPKDKGLNNSYF